MVNNIQDSSSNFIDQFTSGLKIGSAESQALIKKRFENLGQKAARILDADVFKSSKLNDAELAKEVEKMDKEYEKLLEEVKKMLASMDENSGKAAINQAMANATSIPKAVLQFLAGIATTHPSSIVRELAGGQMSKVAGILKTLIEMLVKSGDQSFAKELVAFVKLINLGLEKQGIQDTSEGLDEDLGVNVGGLSVDSGAKLTTEELQVATNEVLSDGIDKFQESFEKGYSLAMGVGDDVENAISSLDEISNRSSKANKNKTRRIDDSPTVLGQA